MQHSRCVKLKKPRQFISAIHFLQVQAPIQCQMILHQLKILSINHSCYYYVEACSLKRNRLKVLYIVMDFPSAGNIVLEIIILVIKEQLHTQSIHIVFIFFSGMVTLLSLNQWELIFSFVLSRTLRGETMNVIQDAQRSSFQDKGGETLQNFYRGSSNLSFNQYGYCDSHRIFLGW